MKRPRSPAKRRGGPSPNAPRDGASTPGAARLDARRTLGDFGVVKRTPPRRFKPGPKAKPPRVVLITSYRARGSIQAKFIRSPTGIVEKEHARQRYFILQSDAPEGFPNSPGVWASNEGLFLGQVNFPGRIPRKIIERMLNVSLGLVDKRGRVRDFRDVYRRWEWKYQVYSRVGDDKKILESESDSGGAR